MSWDCPHQRGRDMMCALRRRICEPLSKGCILAGRFLTVSDKKEQTMNKQAASTTSSPSADVIRADGTVADLVLAHPALRPLLERLGIDYCCGGRKPFAQAVRDAGHDLKSVMDACQRTVQASASTPAATDWTRATVTALADHILATHHVFTRSQLERIDGLLVRVQRAHAAAHGAMLGEVREIFDALRAELESHLAKEEQILFPAIQAIDGYLAGRNARPDIHCGRVAYPIRQMEVEHDAAGAALARLRSLTGGDQAPADACATFQALYEALPALEDDLHEHIHLENNILFPRSIVQEERMA
jgi:regulator of cell morphogenesis and NO signaling